MQAMNLISKEAIECINSHGYSIGEHLGSGGYGKCFVVYSQKYNRNFVCKVMHAAADDRNKRMSFTREVNSLSAIIHPNIVKIYDFFESSDDLFMILEYCEHGSLQDIINDNKTLPYSELRQLIYDVLSAIDFCHKNGIAHHDIKPSNILIDKYGRAKLCDFGLASLWDNSEQCREFAGSVAFMCPEIVQMKSYQPFKADTWAFGVTLYYLVTKRLPFNAGSISTIKKLICEGRRERMYFNMPNEIAKIIDQCLIVDEDTRPEISEIITQFQTDRSQLPKLSKKCKTFNLYRHLVIPKARINHHSSLVY